jgi:CIC family chloride channel protein
LGHEHPKRSTGVIPGGKPPGETPSWAIVNPEEVEAQSAAYRDFSTPVGFLRLIPLAVAVGIIASFIALALLDFIYLLTNLAFYQKVSVAAASPNNNDVGPYLIPIAVAGEVIVGFIARYGSGQIRGHGIPEAMQTILTNGSRVRPRLTVLKPLASAFAIGTGGPFGAEGPIIVTGGALGSVVAQLFRFSAAERRSLLVAGAAAGMTAVFGTPVGATIFGLEVLIFERRPRSLVPIAAACAVADGIRISLAGIGLIAPEPLFKVPHTAMLTGWPLLEAVVVGLVAGAAAWLMTKAVFASEDFFRLVPIHWMWWPALGGVVIALGGLADPKALGVGYNIINLELANKLALGALVLLFFIKLGIWAFALGSGTSGGIIAPILMMGAAVGGIMASALPAGAEPLWALVGMAATLAAMARAPLTGVVFSLELTQDYQSLLPLLIAVFTAHTVSVLILKRSILTEKVVRQSRIPVSAEYAVDPLDALFVREVMRTDVATIEPDASIEEVYRDLSETEPSRRQRLYPVMDADGSLQGLLPWSVILDQRSRDGSQPASQAMLSHYRAVGPEITVRNLADRMVSQGLGAYPVVDKGQLVGVVSNVDVLKARQHLLVEERQREQVLRWWWSTPRRRPSGSGGPEP